MASGFASGPSARLVRTQTLFVRPALAGWASVRPGLGGFAVRSGLRDLPFTGGSDGLAFLRPGLGGLTVRPRRAASAELRGAGGRDVDDLRAVVGGSDTLGLASMPGGRRDGLVAVGVVVAVAVAAPEDLGARNTLRLLE